MRARWTSAASWRYGDELEALNGQPFEGVVVKGQGFSFKVINKYYDSKK